MTDSDELLTFFKALADANRLRILGLLARQPHTVEQLAALLGLGASTVSHHLSKLSEAGLVTANAQSYYNYYRLENERIEAMAHRMLASDTLPAMAAGLPTQPADDAAALAYERKILHDYLLPDGRLKSIPSQRKKLMVILRRLVEEFQPGVQYTEREINQTLARFHPDTASLRREMIGAQLMARESSGEHYWRVDET